jgi:hypothetical protein
VGYRLPLVRLLNPLMNDNEPERSHTPSLVVATVVVILMVFAILCTGRVHAMDSGQWGNEDPNIRAWYKGLMQPDNPAVSCCGEADAYWCDDIGSERVEQQVDAEHPGNTTKFVVKNFCRITDDRPDEPRRRKHIDIGTKFYIPDHKMKWGPNDSQPRVDWTTGQPVELNPTGHAIIFLSRGDYVYCFVPGGGT